MFGFNYYSMGQSPPLKEISYVIKAKTSEQNKVMIIDTWPHGWVKNHAILRYLPSNFIAQELKDNSGGGITIDSCMKLVKSSDIKNLWFIQPNRFSENLYVIKQKFIEQGFSLGFEQNFTKQTAFDLWFKRKINNIPFLKFNNNSPKDYIYTIFNYKRD